jgi:hypothetical protein
MPDKARSRIRRVTRAAVYEAYDRHSALHRTDFGHRERCHQTSDGDGFSTMADGTQMHGTWTRCTSPSAGVREFAERSRLRYNDGRHGVRVPDPNALQIMRPGAAGICYDPGQRDRGRYAASIFEHAQSGRRRRSRRSAGFASRAPAIADRLVALILSGSAMSTGTCTSAINKRTLIFRGKRFREANLLAKLPYESQKAARNGVCQGRGLQNLNQRSRSNNPNLVLFPKGPNRYRWSLWLLGQDRCKRSQIAAKARWK